ncbi:MAG TPA: HD domain-containing phosphohydrolase [Blastocatellia bacterium]|nr:HD domain-containing phosphohydrolase [Blastocatellia bacterium]
MANLTAPPLASSNATPRILIIDDEPNVLSVLYSLLSEQYECKTATNAREALEHLREHSFDLVLSDIMMPGMSGLELLEEIMRLSRDTIVIMISGNLNIQNAIDAMRRGAFDYVTKPFNLSDVEAAVQRALRHQALLKANRQYEQHLEELVATRTQELQVANNSLNAIIEKLYLSYRATLQSLAMALEARDAETKGHSVRVVAYCLRLGKELSLTDRELVTLEHGALLHDIGKIGVPDAILRKRGSLTEEEWVHMRKHVDFGIQIVRGIDFLEGASLIVGQHHERYDGSGYPTGLEGDNIVLGARIFAVADTVDAITSDRPYRAGRPFEAAAEELERFSGKHFDPQVVRAFTRIPLDAWREIRELASEPGLETKDRATGRDVRYSALSVSADRVVSEWEKEKK